MTKQKVKPVRESVNRTWQATHKIVFHSSLAWVLSILRYSLWCSFCCCNVGVHVHTIRSQLYTIQPLIFGVRGRPTNTMDHTRSSPFLRY